MVFAVVGGDGKPTGYEIDNSIRLDRASSSFMQYEPTSTGNQKKFTTSMWFKLGNNSYDLNGDYDIRSSTRDSDNFDVFRIRSDGKLQIQSIISGSSNNGYNFKSDMMFRDSSAFYHLLVAVDTTQATNSNGLKVYINGSLISGTYAAYNQNITTSFNENGLPMGIGRNNNETNNYFDGYIAEVYHIDNQQLAPTEFGETNDNGVWIPKKYSGSYGTNGFKLEFQQTGTSANASGIGADTGGNNLHHSVSNLAATDVTVDTPTNNFCTFNSIDNYYQQYTYAEGNTKVTTNADYYNWNTSTIGVTSGKWYVEAKATQVGTGSDNWVFGVASRPVSNNNDGLGADVFGIAYRNNGNYKTSDTNTTHGAAFSAGDIVMIALDLDAGNVYFGHNGQWADGSGNTDEANPNSAVSLSNLRGSSVYGNTVFFAFGDWNSNASSTVSIGEFNFGNAPYAISSGNTDGKYGNFEYAPPSGYYALCTKRLAEFG